VGGGSTERAWTLGTPPDLEAGGCVDGRTKRVCDDFLRFLVQVRVHKRHVVVAGNNVAQRAQALLDTLQVGRHGRSDDEGGRMQDDVRLTSAESARCTHLHHHALWQGVADVLQLLVCRGRRQQQALPVPCTDCSTARGGGWRNAARLSARAPLDRARLHATGGRAGSAAAP